MSKTLPRVVPRPPQNAGATSGEKLPLCRAYTPWLIERGHDNADVRSVPLPSRWTHSPDRLLRSKGDRRGNLHMSTARLARSTNGRDADVEPLRSFGSFCAGMQDGDLVRKTV